MSNKELLEFRGKEIATIFQDPVTSLDPVFKIGKQMVEMNLRPPEGEQSRSAEDGGGCVESYISIPTPSPLHSPTTHSRNSLLTYPARITHSQCHI